MNKDLFEIFIFCGGKCGGSSLSKTFINSHYNTTHLHSLTCKGFTHSNIDVTNKSNTLNIIDYSIKKYKNISQNIAHFGFSLLILSILFNNIFASEIITNLKVGETFENSKTKIVFESVDQKKEKNYSAIVANFFISNLNGEEDRFSPELRIYNQPVIATSEADIKTTLMSDKFIVINLVQNQDFFNVRYQVKPFMLWIWLSVILISFGGIVSFLQKRS